MGTCPHCGNQRTDCSDPDRGLFVQRTICYPHRERLAAERVYSDLHEAEPYHDGTYQSWAEKPSAEHPFKYDDGVHIYVSAVEADPDDEFLTDKNAVPSNRRRDADGAAS